jgi:hypothetical protein
MRTTEVSIDQSLSLDFKVKPGVQYLINDHLGGFDKELNNPCLSKLSSNVTKIRYIVTDKLKEKYPNIKSDIAKDFLLFDQLTDYNMHPEVNFKNFVCSFNGSGHVSRQLLTSILQNQGYFNLEYSSKNFAYDNNWIVSHLDHLGLTDSEMRLYEKFFVNKSTFNDTIYSFGHVQYSHANNIYNLEDKLTRSFVHIVSETMATSYYPFVTEKFFYSIVTRGLFVAYAQPGWHKHIETYFGFKLYDKIFDYSFDEIQNPVKRLVRLIEMISKFSMLSVDDWKDLYHLEQDVIEYNYDHYFSGNYKKHLEGVI